MKKVLILDDSYSTYEGQIPEGYPTYYSSQGRPDSPVSKMRLDETWWIQLAKDIGRKLSKTIVGRVQQFVIQDIMAIVPIVLLLFTVIDS